MIEISAKQIEQIETILSNIPGGMEKAISSAMSRAQSAMRSTAIKGITQYYDIKPDAIRDRKKTTINLTKRKIDGGIIGSVKFSGGKIPLYRFGVSHKAPKSKPYRVPVNFGGNWAMANPGVPVSARQLKSSPLKLFRNSFIAVMQSGHYGMFERMGRGSTPIREFMGASTPEMAERTQVRKKAEDAAIETMSKRLEHEITRILNGHGMR